jgi:hypothetical protein
MRGGFLQAAVSEKYRHQIVRIFANAAKHGSRKVMAMFGLKNVFLLFCIDIGSSRIMLQNFSQPINFPSHSILKSAFCIEMLSRKKTQDEIQICNCASLIYFERKLNSS